MKKQITNWKILAVIMMVIFTATGVFGQTFSINPVSLGNDQFRVDVKIHDVTNLFGASVTLQFDDAGLQYQSVTQGSFLTGAHQPPPLVVGNKITVDQARLDNQGSTGTGTLFSVFFNKTGTVGAYSIHEYSMVNTSNQAITVSSTSVNKLDQTITFAGLPDKAYGDEAFDLSATSSSGLTVSFAVSGPVSLSGNTVTITGAGAVTVMASQAGDGNCNAAVSVERGFNIGKAALTVTADNKSKVYGASEPELTYTPSGTLYYGDSYSVISGVILSTATGGAATAGSHTINASGGTATNYNITHDTGTLTVSKATLTVTADDNSKVYGASEPALTYTPSGTLFYGDQYSVILGVSLSTATGSAATAGTHTITASGGSAANYNVNHVNGTLTVGKAELTVTADDKSKVYGASEPTLTNTPSGTLYYDDSYSVISGVILSTATAGAATAGTHTITASGGTASNYNVTYVNGTLTVGKAELTVTADDKSKVYGASAPELTYTPSGVLYYGDLYSVISGVVLSTATEGAATAGTHTITASGGTAANYNITHVNGTLTVGKAELTVTADDKSKVYGASEPALTYTPSGELFYEDGYDVISGVLLSAPTSAAASAGTHEIIASGGGAANYNVNHFNGTLTVDKAPALIVTAENKSKVYGASEPSLTYTSSGTLHYTDTYSVITGVSLSTATGAAASAGTHEIIASGGSAINYNVNHFNGTLTVEKAPALTVTADNKSKVYGESEPELTYTPSGTLHYTDSYSVIIGVNLLTATGAAATAGAHTITASGGSALNYYVSHANGTLTVEKAPALTVTADNKSKVYGAAEPALTYTSSGTLYYDDEYSVITGVSLSTVTGESATAGTHAIIASGGSANNYNVNHVSGSLTVEKAPALTVNADNKSKVYGESEPVLTYTPTGTLYYNEEYSVITGVSLSTATGSAATAGTHTITASGGSAANYYVNYVNGTLTVDKTDLTVTANDRTRQFGVANPDFFGVIVGIKYSDNITASYTSIADESTPAGVYGPTSDYAIKPSLSDPDSRLGNYNITLINGTLTISEVVATLTIVSESLTQTYDGNPKEITVTTNPPDLTGVIITYNGLPDPPTNAGSYDIVVTLDNPNYTADPVNGTLIIQKADATISLSNLIHTYDGTAKSATASTVPSGLTGVAITYDESSTAPTNAGTYAVVATLTHMNYTAIPATGNLVIEKALATLTFVPGSLSHIYDGSPKSAVVTTNPAGLSGGVAITYDGSSDLPVNAATYAVVASLTHNNYYAEDISNNLIISKADQTITFDVIGDKTYLDDPFTVSPTASSGLGVSVSIVSGPATVDGYTITITGAGFVTVRASQLGDDNYNAAPDVDRTFTVNKAAAIVTLVVESLSHTYDGNPKSAEATTDAPGESSFIFTYNGSDVAPSGIGSYSVVAALVNDNYQGSASGTMTISASYNLYLSSSTSEINNVIYPNSSWSMPDPMPDGYLGSDNDWGFTGPVEVYILAEAGAVFGSCDITIEYNNTMLNYTGADFDGSVFEVALRTISSVDNTVRIQATRSDNATITAGNFIAKLSFDIIKPGYGEFTFTNKELVYVGFVGTNLITVTGSNAEMKAYLGDVAKSGGVSTGDGKIDFHDLSPWSTSYWSGVTGYIPGMTHYKVKYDVGPTVSNTVYGLPTIDGKINFEDLVIFAISYGFSGNSVYPKISVPEKPVKLYIEDAVIFGNEVHIPLYISGAVENVRGMELVFESEYGKFLGVNKGSLLNGYSTPIMVMSRSAEQKIYVDFAIMGVDMNGINREGELVILRFEGKPEIKLVSASVRNLANAPMLVKLTKKGDEVPETFGLSQNYPNPFNPVSVIEYQLPAGVNVEISVYNMLGEKVTTLVNSVQEAGYYRVEWNGKDSNQKQVASGIYFYTMRAGEFTSVKKMMLLK